MIHILTLKVGTKYSVDYVNRLYNSIKRNTQGQFESIASDLAAVEVAEKVKALIDQYGPRSVAIYVGTPNVGYPGAAGMGNAFLRALGSRMFFTSNTIDQPGKQIAMAAHGKWLGGEPDFDKADAWLLLGNNPIISKLLEGNRGVILIISDKSSIPTKK